MALRIYKFEFRGGSTAGQVVVVANSFLEAKGLVKLVQPFCEEPNYLIKEKGEVIEVGVVFYDNGGY